MEKQLMQKYLSEKGKWRRLDNTAKLFAAVAGEDFSNVFRISVTLKENIKEEILRQALPEVLGEFSSFRVKLRRGFFWNYFEANLKEPLIEEESTYPCKFIDPHSSHMYLFRVSYFKRRINLEIFHGLTDGMGAVNFMNRLTVRYLELSGSIAEDESTLKNQSFQESETQAENRKEDGYLKYYKKRPHSRYVTERAMEIEGEMLPLDTQSILHGYLDLAALKRLCREEGVSITKYLTALCIWSVIEVYGDKQALKRPVAVNLPINLRSFFDSETMANFFAVTNIRWPAGKRPGSFEEVLAETSRQMDEKIVKEKLEETISYNVSNEKKWYIRIVPLFVKHMVMNRIFKKSSGAYTMTLSNLGIASPPLAAASEIAHYDAFIGVSGKQKVKCTTVAFGDRLSVSFNSMMNDMKLQNYFFNFLREKGVDTELVSNGVVDKEHDRGTYPAIFYDKKFLKKMVNIFYLILFTAALVTGLVNVATYSHTRNWWSIIAIGGIAYVAITLRYSIMRRATLAGILVIESLGAQFLLVLIDYMTGFSGWSFNYAIPSVLLFDLIAAVFLILVNRMNWQSYFMYQVAITVFTFIPLILWAAGLITQPLMACITVLLSVSVMFVTIIMGDRSVKNEIKRRFHL